MPTTVFFGSSDYCVPILNTLRTSLKLVVTRPDKPFGRKQALTPSPVKIWAEENQVPVFTPLTLRSDSPDRTNLVQLLSELSPDLGIVADFGLIIPETIFKTPKYEIVNIHFSKLPDLRGPSPIQFGLLRGDTEAWVTIFKLESSPTLKIKMDSGPIIWQASYPISPEDTTQTLYQRLFQHVAPLLPDILATFVLNSTATTPQDHSKATFCRFLTRQDGFISWPQLEDVLSGKILSKDGLPQVQQEALATRPNTSATLYNFYQAVTPWPGLWTIYPNGKRLKILRCHEASGKLILDQVQFEGKNPEPAQGLI